MIKKHIPYLVSLSFLATAFIVQASAHGDETGNSLDNIIAGDHRAPGNAARNIYRHPVETLRFFGLKPEMTVVEIWPGGGWYTEILAPYVKGHGKYYAAGADQSTKEPRRIERIERYANKLKAHPDMYGEVIVTELSSKKTNIAPPASADMVLTFRNVHNWMKHGFDKTIFKAMYDTLKPGGILGVVEHRADPGKFPDPQTLSGYVHESQIKQRAESVGFKFVKSSEINANPKDTRDHSKGVWTLPPSLRLGDKDKAKYLAIGESDRMTLMFRKPEAN